VTEHHLSRHVTSRVFANGHMDGRLFWYMTVLDQTRWGAHLENNKGNSVNEQKSNRSLCSSHNQWCHALMLDITQLALNHTMAVVSHIASHNYCHVTL